jgi:toxin ParE1/3/4
LRTSDETSFLPEAEAEYLEAVAFYEGERAGLGARLIADFERTIRLAIERPTAWKVVHADAIRRIDLNRFPYAVFFRVAPSVMSR